MNLRQEKPLLWIFPPGGNDLSYYRPVLVAFALLPERVQQQAEKAYGQWRSDPYYQGLHFKCIHETKSVYSVRIGIGYRALGRRHGEEMIWFWIGTHEAYNKLIKRL